MSDILNEISTALQKGKSKQVKQLVPQALEEGIPAQQILDEALLAGMGIIGELFKNDEVFVPEVLVAAKAMNAGVAILQPYLADGENQVKGKCVIATVKGDLHDIGKNLVKMMMEGKGIEVIDMGNDVPAEDIVAKAKEENAQIIALSALITTTMREMASVVEAAEAAGIRDQVKIMVGGAPVTEEFAKAIGADIYTSDAATAADVAAELLA